MTISIPHSSSDFKKNEIKTLGIICSRGFFENDFAELAAAIQSFYDRYRNETWKRGNNFEFVADFETVIQKKSHTVVLHAQVVGDYEYSTYSMGICGEMGSSELIRRFHFDYVHNNRSTLQKVPISHLQYGGKSGHGYNGQQFNTTNLEDWLSLPRLQFPPINLALLLDIAFCEFHNERSVRIAEDPNWRNLIKENEIFLLKNYYDVISSHIGSARHKKEILIRDICYGS